MSFITKEDFLEWKELDVTKAFFAAASERVEDAKEILANEAGKDPDNDNFFRGFIYAYNEMREFRVEDEE